MDREANSSKLRNIIAFTIIAAATGGAGYLVGKGNVPPPAPVAEIEVARNKQAVPAVADVALGRADIIRLANEAADAASGGPALVDPLDGRRFVVRIPIGCGVPALRESGHGATYSVDDGVLRISVQPQDWSALPWVKNELARRQVVAAEGFWIPRPWTRSESCPVQPAQPAQPAQPVKSTQTTQPDEPARSTDTSELTVQTDGLPSASWLGIAQLFDSESSRVGQLQGRALQATVPIDTTDAAAGKAVTMVLAGRVARWPGGTRTVLCNAARPTDRPTCLVGVKLDSISIENAATGARLSEWQF